jgi:heptosyltransferase-2
VKVLLIRLSSLGDVVLATSAVEAVREDVPGAEVHVLTKPAFREVFQGNPAVADVLEWSPGDAPASVAREVRSRGYDWVADLHGNVRTRLLRAWTPRLRWLVYSKGSLRRRLAVALRSPTLLDATHVAERYAKALGPLGVAARPRLPRVYPPPSAQETASRALRAGGWDGSSPLLALAPGARWATKAWPKERWAELLGAVAAGGLGFPVLLGGAEDALLCREILAGAGGYGTSVAGRTSVLESAAVLSRAAAVVTNDSALLHLASAVGRPVVALFGPTVRGFGFYPLGPTDAVLERALACRPCSLHGGERCRLGHHRCLAEISGAEVLAALEAVLLERPPPSPYNPAPSPNRRRPPHPTQRC